MVVCDDMVVNVKGYCNNVMQCFVWWDCHPPLSILLCQQLFGQVVNHSHLAKIQSGPNVNAMNTKINSFLWSLNYHSRIFDRHVAFFLTIHGPWWVLWCPYAWNLILIIMPIFLNIDLWHVHVLETWIM